MSFIASMVSTAIGGGFLGAAAGASATAAAGAGLGAATSAITGGDVGKGAMIGGISGLASGAIGALGPAFQGGDVAAQVGEKAVEQGTQQVAQEGVNQAAQQAVQQGAQQVAQEGASQTAQQVAQKSAEQLAQEGVSQTAQQGAGFAGLGPQGTSVVPTAAPNSLGAAGNQSAANMLGQQSVMNSSSGGISTLPGQPGFVGPTATPDQIANASAYTDANMGTRFLADLTNQQGNIVGNTGLKMAGGALQSGVMNAGINGLVAGTQGQDVGEAMGKGALTGAVGGAAGAGLASMAGSGGTLGSIGNFAAKHDVLVPAALSMGSGMALDSALTSNPTAPEQKGIRSLYKWNPSVYKPYGPQFAAGGVTDLDNYDQTPQMQNPGTLDIPNRNEVANNQGYMGDSVQMMAHGGVSDLGGYSDGGRLLKGPGDGVSDDIPASIGGKQPARLATGEFVLPARIVSELGNGSTDAGAKRLYQMMDRIQSDRKKTTGKGKFSDNPKAYKHLPA
jgi:osmotically inducible lipoprotein OsmB